MTIQEIRKYVNDKKANQQLLSDQLNEKINLIDQKKQHTDNLIQARFLLSEASRLTQLKVKEKIARMKFISEEEEHKFDDIEKEMKKEIEKIKGNVSVEGRI